MIRVSFRDVAEFAYDCLYAFRAGFRDTVPDRAKRAAECPSFIEIAESAGVYDPDATVEQTFQAILSARIRSNADTMLETGGSARDFADWQKESGWVS